MHSVKMNDWAVTLTLRDSSRSKAFFVWVVFVGSWQNGRYGSEGAWSGTEWSARNVRKRNGTWTLSFARRKICGLSHELPALKSCSSTGVVTSFNILKYRHSLASRITLQLTASHHVYISERWTRKSHSNIALDECSHLLHTSLNNYNCALQLAPISHTRLSSCSRDQC